MDEVIFVEVLGRDGQAVQRHPVTRLPATLGRGYDNDVILDDSYVAAHHARLSQTESGELLLADLGSRNGLLALDPTRRVSQTVVHPDARFRIGHTQLRIRPQSYAVPAEREEPASPRFRRAATFVGLYAAALACILLYSFVSTYEGIDAVTLAMPAVWVMLGAPAWAGLWAFAGKAMGGRGNFIAHASIASAAVTLLIGLETVGGYAAFAFSSRAIYGGRIAPMVGVAAWGLFNHLKLVSRHRRRTLALSACGIVIALLGGWSLPDYANQKDAVNHMAFLREIKSPRFRLVRGESPETFFAAVTPLRPQVDALRRNK